MPMTEPFVLTSPKKLPYLGFLPLGAELQHYGVTGFEIPTLPAVTPEYKEARSSLVEEVLYRFQLYLLELHGQQERRAIALQLMAHPELSTLDSRVRVYVLCRSARDTPEAAAADVAAFAAQAKQSFPREGLFNYGQPV